MERWPRGVRPDAAEEAFLTAHCGEICVGGARGLLGPSPPHGVPNRGSQRPSTRNGTLLIAGRGSSARAATWGDAGREAGTEGLRRHVPHRSGPSATHARPAPPPTGTLRGPSGPKPRYVGAGPGRGTVPRPWSLPQIHAGSPTGSPHAADRDRCRSTTSTAPQHGRGPAGTRGTGRRTTEESPQGEAAMNRRFLDVLSGKEPDATPIWLMRQAGR